MKANSALFSIVFLSLFFPIAGTVLGISRGALIHFPFVFSALLALIQSSRKSLSVRQDWLSLSLLVLSVLVPIQLLLGRGFGALASGGYVVLCSIIFYGIFVSEVHDSLGFLIRWVSSLYKFLMLTLLGEAVLVLAGMQPLLAAALPDYRTYMSADIPHALGLMQGAGGLNSFLIDAQIGGMLSLFSAIWFLGAARHRNLIGERRPMLWSWFSLFLFAFTITATNAVLFMIALFTYGLYRFKGWSRWKWSILFFSLSAAVVVLAMNALLFPRIFNETPIIGHLAVSDPNLQYNVWFEIKDFTVMEYYFWAFASPIRAWIEVDWLSKLIGVSTGFFDRTYVTGDFALGFLMLQSGILFIVTFILTISSCYLFFLRRENDSDELRLFSEFGAINSIICVLFLASTAHYSAALANSGAIMLFSMHLALSFYCRYHLLHRKKL